MSFESYLSTMAVVVGGYDDRSVRFAQGGGMATCTYSFHLDHAARRYCATRIEALWNANLGIATESLTSLATERDRLEKVNAELLAVLENIVQDEAVCDCEERGWYGDTHDSACPITVVSVAISRARE